MSAVLDKETAAKNKRLLGWLLAIVTVCFGLSYFLRPFLAEELIHGKRSSQKLYQQFHRGPQQ